MTPMQYFLLTVIAAVALLCVGTYRDLKQRLSEEQNRPE